MKSFFLKYLLFYFAYVSIGRGQNLDKSHFSLFAEPTLDKVGFTKKAIIRYKISPYYTNGEKTSYDLTKGDTAFVITIREGAFLGKYQKWAAIQYFKLPKNIKDNELVIVPLEVLETLHFRFYKLNEDKDIFKKGDTLMMPPFQEETYYEQEKGLYYPKFIIKNNKRFGLFYKVGFKNITPIKLPESMIEFLESQKVMVEYKNETYNNYLNDESEQKNKLFNMSIYILLTLGTIFLLYWVVKQSKKGATKSIDLTPIKHENSLKNLAHYFEEYLIAREQFAIEKQTMTNIQIEKAEKLWNQKWLEQDFRRKNLVIEATVVQISEFGAILKIENFDFDGRNNILNINYNYSYVKNSSYTTGGTTFRDFDGKYVTIGEQKTHFTSKVISKKDLKSLLKYNIGDKMVCTGNMKIFSINSQDNPQSITITIEYYPIYY